MTLHAASKLIKGEARYSLLGHLPVAVGTNVVYFMIVIGLTILANGAVPGDGIVSQILTYAAVFLTDIILGTLQFGLSSLYMNLQYQQEASLGDLFRGFRESSLQIVQIQSVYTVILLIPQIPVVIVSHFVNQYWSTITDEPTTIVLLIVAMIACLLLDVVVSVWASLAYALVWYILLDYPEMKWREVMRRSRVMMKGNKRVLLYLQLSFIPLYLVSVVSLGIASLWIKAYQRATEAAFYRGLMNAHK